MKEPYSIVVEDHVFNFSQDDITGLDILRENAFQYHLILQNQSYSAKVLSSDFNRRIYEIQINGKKFKVRIHSPLDSLIKDMGLSIKSEKNINELMAPMPGLIININVKEGDSVNENDPLLILEAMKMENIMVAPRAGKIKSISVKTGQTVDKNEILIEFE